MIPILSLVLFSNTALALDLRDLSGKDSKTIVQVLKDAKIETQIPEEEPSAMGGGHPKAKLVDPTRLYIVKLVYCEKTGKVVTCDRPGLTGKPALTFYEALSHLKGIERKKSKKGNASIFVKELICFPPDKKLPALCRAETHFSK